MKITTKNRESLKTAPTNREKPKTAPQTPQLIKVFVGFTACNTYCEQKPHLFIWWSKKMMIFSPPFFEYIQGLTVGGLWW